MLAVKLLGQFGVQRDGTPLVIPSRPAQSLLAFLLLNAGIPHRREKLAGLLWPETPEDHARRSLRQELWRLRKALEPSPASDGAVSYLQSDDITITFVANSESWMDATELERGGGEGATADELMRVLSLYHGELLPGFYDEWVALERERLRAVYEEKMARLLECLQGEQRWGAVREWAERWIGLGGSPEPAYRALMVAHGEAGDMSQVAAVYQRCVETLRDDLGVAPSEQTRLLFERLRAAPQASTAVGAQRPDDIAPPVARSLAPLPVHSTASVLDESPAPGEPPFKGMQYFEEADADLFFGRERLIAQLVAHLSNPPSPAGDMLVVIGASGSGKSSLVRAGLVPTLKRAGWHIHLITPTAHPLQALAVSLTRDAESIMATTTLMDDLARDARTLHLYAHKIVKDRNRLLLVVDQFEELFTLCRDQVERKEFVDNLLTAISPDRGGPITVIITLRADFYAHCSQYAGLREAVSKNQEYIGPMTAEELRRAIEGPAQRGGWAFEPGLVDLILHDLGDEPGALPLLSHALLETWERRQGHRLTLKGYADCGGVRGAIAQTAETVFHQLAPQQQKMARRIFLQLTELGEGTQDTRRRATIGELVSHSADAPAIEEVLRLLAEARLITIGEGTVQVAHEALIREWHTLREWLTEDRDGLRLHRHLTEAAQAWDKLNRDAGELYRGARLAQALEWAKTNGGELNPLEREFLDASKQWQERQEAEREAQRQRELEAAQRLVEAEAHRAEAERHHAEVEQRRAEEQVGANRKLRQRAILLASALFVAAMLAVAALALAGQSNQNAQRAENERRTAFVRELSVNAVNNLVIDPERSILLALQAVSVSSASGKPVLLEAEEALHRAVVTSRVQLTLRDQANGVNGVAISPDGSRLATISYDGTARVWDAVTGRELLKLSTYAKLASASHIGLAFSPDGKRLATSSGNNTAKVWDAVSGEQLVTLAGHTDVVRAVTYSTDGKRLATASADKTARVWDAKTGKELLVLSGHSDPLWAVAYSPDGTRVATASVDRTAKVWDAESGKELLTFSGHPEQLINIVFSPDSKKLATVANDATAQVWDAASGRVLLILPHPAIVRGIAFDATGTRLATASVDGKARVYDATTGQLLLTLVGHTSDVNDVVFSPDGTRLVTASLDKTARVWDISTGGSREWLTLADHTNRVEDVVYSKDGKRLATISADKTAKVWDAASGQVLLTLLNPVTCTLRTPCTSISFSADGHRLATVSPGNTAKVWDAATGQLLLILAGHTDPLLTVVFDSDGKRLATGGYDNTARVWDATTGKELLTLSGHKDAVYAVAFNPDGTRLATASWDGTAKLWDVANGKELLTFTGHTSYVRSVAFSPDGTRLATSSEDGTAKVWDVATGKVLLTLSGHAGTVFDAVFSPDGSHLATSSTDQTVKVWDLSLDKSASEQPLTLYGHSAAIYRVVFSPDGKRLATASRDGTARVWALPLEDIITIAKSRVTRSLTTDECQKFLHADQCPADPRIGSNVITPINH